MYKNIKNFMLIKKRLLLIVFLISSFLFVGNIKAQTCTSNYNVNYSSFDSSYYSRYDEVYTYLKDLYNNQNTYQYYVIYFNYDTFTHSGINFYLNITMFNDTNVYIDYNSSKWSRIYSSASISYFNSSSLTSSGNITYLSTTSNPVLTSSGSGSGSGNFILLESNYDIPIKKDVCFTDKDNNIELLSTNSIMPLYYNEQFPEISFTSQNYTTNNDIYKKDVTIDFGYINNDRYAYMYLDTNDNIWHSLFLTEDSSYTLTLYKNTNIIAQVIDKDTQEVFTNATFLVNDIHVDLDIKIVVGQNYNSFGVVTSIPIEIYFYSDDRSNYIYDYYSSIWGDNAPWLQLNDDISFISFTEYYDTLITARIKDLQGNVLYTKTYNIENVVRVPQINFFNDPTWTYETYIGPLGEQLGRNCIYNTDVWVDYGYLDNSKYIYQYSLDSGDSWVTLNIQSPSKCTYDEEDLTCVGVYVPLTSNGYIVARVLNYQDNSVVNQASFTINNIGICNVPGDSTGTFEVNHAFSFWVSPIQEFLSIVSYFWNGLPLMLKYFFEFIFILTIILLALRFLL